MSQREFSPSSPAIPNAPERSAVARERFHATRQAPAVFRSVLTSSSDREQPAEQSEAPAFFRDLNLDQIVASIIVGKQEYNLAPFFNRPLKTVEAIEYRQEVMRDLEDQDLVSTPINDFASSMRLVRDHVAQAGKLYYKHQKQAWSLDAIELYCKAVAAIAFPIARLAAPIGRPHGFPRLSRRLCRVVAVSGAREGRGGAQGRSGLDPLQSVDRKQLRHRLGLSRRSRLRRRDPVRLREVPAGGGRRPRFQVRRLPADEPYRGRRSRSRRAPLSRNLRRAPELHRAKRRLHGSDGLPVRPRNPVLRRLSHAYAPHQRRGTPVLLSKGVGREQGGARIRVL